MSDPVHQRTVQEYNNVRLNPAFTGMDFAYDSFRPYVIFAEAAGPDRKERAEKVVRATGRVLTFLYARWLAFTILVCAQVVRAYANRSLRVPLHRLGTNGFLLAACIGVVVVQILIPLIPPLAEAFRASPLSAEDWILVAIVAFVPALLAEIVRTVRGSLWVA